MLPNLRTVMRLTAPKRRIGSPRNGTTRVDGTLPKIGAGGLSVNPRDWSTTQRLALGIPNNPRLPVSANKAIGRAQALQSAPSPTLTEGDSVVTPSLLPYPDAPTLYDPNTRPAASYDLTGDPEFPITTAPLSRMEQLKAFKEASLPPSPYRAKAAEVAASLARIKTQMDGLNNDFSPMPLGNYVPPLSPQREQLPIPTRQNLQPPESAQILSAIAGLIAPQSAGNFYAVPYQAAQQEGERQYTDALKQNALKQHLADTRFADASNARQSIISTDLYNRNFDMSRRAADRQLELERLGVRGDLAQTESLAGALPELTAADEKARQNANSATQAQSEINAGLLSNQERLQQYAGAVTGTAAENKSRLEHALALQRIATESGDKAAGRKTTERGQDFTREVGLDRNAVAKTNAANRLTLGNNRLEYLKSKLGVGSGKADDPLKDPNLRQLDFVYRSAVNNRFRAERDGLAPPESVALLKNQEDDARNDYQSALERFRGTAPLTEERPLGFGMSYPLPAQATPTAPAGRLVPPKAGTSSTRKVKTKSGKPVTVTVEP